jgi:hypothetical protein
MLNIELCECDVDDLIMLEQSHLGGKRGSVRSSAQDISIDELVAKYIKSIGKAFNVPSETPQIRAKCIEICGFSNSQTNYPQSEIKGLVPEKLYRPFYGLLTADEGWRFVPAEIAKDRMQLRWSTRSYLDVIAYQNAVLVINLENENYKNTQTGIRKKYGHDLDPYFAFSTKIAGLKNGPLLRLENAFLQLFIINQVSEACKERGSSIKGIEMNREKLLDAFQNLSCINIPELDILGKKVLKAMKIPRATKDLKENLGTVENSLTLKYNQRINNEIIVLTLVSLGVGILSLLKQFDFSDEIIVIALVIYVALGTLIIFILTRTGFLKHLSKLSKFVHRGMIS